MADIFGALAFGGSSTSGSLTSGSVVGGGTNRAVLAATCARDLFGTSFRYGGSGGTSVPALGADLGFAFDNTGSGKLNTWGDDGGPTGSTTLYATWSSTVTVAAGAFLLEDVDQAAPFGSEQAGADNLYSFDQDRAVSITVTGLTSGQLVCAFLGIKALDTATTGGLSSVTAGANTTVQSWAGGTPDGATEQAGLALLSGVATGSSLTLNATVSTPSAGLVAFRLTAFPVNSSGGAASAFNPLTGRGGAAAQPLAI